MKASTPASTPYHSPKDWIDLFKEAPCGYILTAPNGRILKVNDTLCNWLKFLPEEMENTMRFQELLSIGSKLFYETRHIALLKLHDQANEINYDLKCKDGTSISVLLNSSQHKDGKGNIVAYQYILLPFSDRKKYEIEILNAKKASEEAVRAKSIFLSTITHEIRTPIHAILNAGNILLQEYSSQEQRELLEVINFSSNNLLELVNSVLDLSKMEVGKVKIEEAPFNIRGVFERLLQVYRPLALGKDVNFELIISETVPEIMVGDGGKIRQIFTNLIGNAIKFTQQGTIRLQLSLKATVEDRYIIHFELKDEGIGMSESELAKIFDPFTQANDTIHKNFGGSGLGLSIVQKLLNLLDSQLTVSSRLGEGSTFSFDLCLQRTLEEVKEEKTEEILERKEDLSHIKILVVDDIFSNILVIKHYFKIWNIPFEHVTNGEEALKRVQEKDFDLVFMDLNMPEMDGYQTTECIRALPEAKYMQLPIIALSAYDANDIKFKVKRSGMNGLVQKPFRANQFYQTIIEYVGTADKRAVHADPTIEVTRERTNHTEFSTKILCEIFENDCEAIQNYFEVVRIELTQVIEDFVKIETNFSLSAYRAAVHKNISLLTIFQLDALRSKMIIASQLLSDDRKQEFLHTSKEIRVALGQLADWIREQSNSKQSVCE
ncbi:ATP-binding protein [Aquimarina sp. 2-A2]|uniref:ATP-binding protein n=1 Tax=Aquimarina sp. 2-A2 TaxID=3382644 RepID=UPI00387F2D9D